MQRGFELAIRNQQMIVMQGKIVIDKTASRTAEKFPVDYDA